MSTSANKIETMKIETVFGEPTDMIIESRFANGDSGPTLHRILEGGRCIAPDMTPRGVVNWLKLQGLAPVPGSGSNG